MKRGGGGALPPPPGLHWSHEPANPQLIGIFLLLAAALSCGADEADPAPAAAAFARLTLVPERPPVQDEALWLEVFIGALPAGASLAIADGEGNPLGAIAPTAKACAKPAAATWCRCPRRCSRPKKSSCGSRCSWTAKSAPTAEQLRKVELAYVPVSQ